jgi:hypothetical protein
MSHAATPPEPYGPPDLLDNLQPRMEERIARRVPVEGRFCGFCYARLRDTDTVCPLCRRDPSEEGTVDAIPQEVLRAYRAKSRTEATWVYSLGFVGLIVASVLFVVLVVWGPGPLGHPGVGFTVLIGGGYLLARLTGEWIGGPIGHGRGRGKRDRLWREFVNRRDAGSST